jgi:tricorn protease-like protein
MELRAVVAAQEGEHEIADLDFELAVHEIDVDEIIGQQRQGVDLPRWEGTSLGGCRDELVEPRSSSPPRRENTRSPTSILSSRFTKSKS